jgi:hypothetical protein
VALSSKNDCIKAMALAKNAEAAHSYLLGIIEQYKNDLLNDFINTKVDLDEDFMVLCPVKRRFDALLDLRNMIESHINEGKVAQKMIDKLD